MKRYDQARADFEALEKIVELDDQVELDAARLYLMRDPTKKRAADMYEAGIRLWFREHCISNYPEAIPIARKYNINISLI